MLTTNGDSISEDQQRTVADYLSTASGTDTLALRSQIPLAVEPDVWAGSWWSQGPALVFIGGSAKSTTLRVTGIDLVAMYASSVVAEVWDVRNAWVHHVRALKTKDAPKAQAKVPSPQEDYAWFYIDLDRVDQYRGRFVAVLDRRVVKAGTAKECHQAAKEAGAKSPLVFRVPEKKGERTATIGL